MTTAERFFLVEVAGDGLLLDLQSGLLVRLNGSAAFVWRHHLQGLSNEAVADRLAEHYRIAGPQALRDTKAALRVDLVEAPAEPPGEYSYQHTAAGYVFAREGRPLLVIDDDGRFLSRAPDAAVTREELWQCLQGVAPKLLALRGQTVLHASAVELGRGVAVFSGASGAGKTTTARALVRAGARPVCEDKLVVRLEADQVQAAVDTEAIVARWVDQATADLDHGGVAACDVLADIGRQGHAVITEAGFVSATRRRGDDVAAQSLTVADASGALFSNSFHGSKDPVEWKRHLTASVQLASRLAAFSLSMPDGLPELEVAAARLVQRGSLRP